MKEFSFRDFGTPDGSVLDPETGVRFITKLSERDKNDPVLFLLCQAAAEDHSGRMNPYEGDTGDETEGLEHCL